MKTPVLFVAAAWAAIWLVPATRGYGADPGVTSHSTDCDEVSKKIIAQIKKDPQKVLMVVEDFMVSNPNCAAEIVKAAVTSTKGPADLKKQIAITATHVVPEMAKTISDAIASVAPEEATDIQVATQKEAGGQTPTTTVAQNEPSTEETNADSGNGDDYKLPTDLRGVFFIQPISAGSAQAIINGTTSSGSTTKTTTKTTKVVAKNNTVAASPPNRPSSLSPSSGSP